MKKGTQSRRRRQPMYTIPTALSFNLYFSPRSPPHTHTHTHSNAVGPTKGKVAGAEQRSREEKREERTLKRIQKVKDAFSSFLLFTRTNKQLKVIATPIIWSHYLAALNYKILFWTSLTSIDFLHPYSYCFPCDILQLFKIS